jgi:hypothetical protein
MKVIIAGGRDFTDFDYVKGYMATLPPWLHVTEVVCGKASGADALGERWAKLYGIPVKEFPADWATFNKRAGPLRNLQMAEYADGLVAFWDGKSTGTADMIMQAQHHGLWTYVVRTDLQWNKQFKNFIHNGKTHKVPDLNNVDYTDGNIHK